MTTKTPQPSPPYMRDGKWFFTFYKVLGPEDIGPYEDEIAAKQVFITALRVHEANGYTDGPITSVIS
jgi:hypothetical protein